MLYHLGLYNSGFPDIPIWFRNLLKRQQYELIVRLFHLSMYGNVLLSISRYLFGEHSYSTDNGYPCRQKFLIIFLNRIKWKKNDLTLYCSFNAQAIMGGVAGFWGGVFSMGSIYLLMVFAKRVFNPEEGEEKGGSWLEGTVRHVTGNDQDYLRKIPRVVVQKSALL